MSIEYEHFLPVIILNHINSKLSNMIYTYFTKFLYDICKLNHQIKY